MSNHHTISDLRHNYEMELETATWRLQKADKAIRENKSCDVIHKEVDSAGDAIERAKAYSIALSDPLRRYTFSAHRWYKLSLAYEKLHNWFVKNCVRR